MENPPSPGKTPNKKKKRNPSFRRYLRKQGIDVRRRKYRKPGRRRDSKRKKIASDTAAPADEANGESTPNDSSAAGPTSSRSDSPASLVAPSSAVAYSPPAVTSPLSGISSAAVSSPTAICPPPGVASSAGAVASPVPRLLTEAAKIDDRRETDKVG
ncbi:uncharacterized protein N7500_002582 [Penicillium coprophilum]|uniref:uncharacterized protein n=1 Tax=Penicillium coprophilum TaxID=36646 RepID=UPI00239F5150|nr:uncharacterized protein N7500_002582 [Penicillium coprophilum]KAJ5169799.1 hypothetical protein N7500_002582 [Penicillium coprophilum]